MKNYLLLSILILLGCLMIAVCVFLRGDLTDKQSSINLNVSVGTNTTESEVDIDSSELDTSDITVSDTESTEVDTSETDSSESEVDGTFPSITDSGVWV